MSDASRQNLKVSREGIVLIKSFEGFRPRAIRREDCGWIIGYGHTLSAREGASVSEADAELLLRYDLLPVEKTVNETVPGDLNQHQFDALVSFAFSVGVDRFAGSDVRQCLNAGAPGEAADAMMGWPEPALPETALRRRAAERALFVANPLAPVALSDLLSAPLPPPAVAASPKQVEVEIPAATMTGPDAVPDASIEVAAPIDPRSAAVAALLGETAARIIEAEAPPAPSNDNPPADSPAEAEAVSPEPAAEPLHDEPSAPEGDDAVQTAVEVETTLEPTPAPAPLLDPVVLNASRYAPYSAVMIGPLPFLQPATPREEPVEPEARTIERTIVELTPSEVVESKPQADEPVPVLIETPSSPAETVAVDPAPVAELVLTPLADTPEPTIERPLWTPEEREAPDASENNLFGEDLALTQGGGSILRNDIEFEPPARFDWSETGPFIFMGGVGLVSFGASMAAFRRAAEHSGGNELTLIGWVLALIGLACVGVSSINLYRRFGLPGGD
ncbi:glycoside hydrolase family protein [Brevundimonas sp.]|uniref:glycoside hydrolase family protein n=1 Tax=Brevundimonas sp. TaxID=1871086 RepID=UPI00286BF2E2|nr:glycoside hydrolase family protein [Brevundimonas sp.]